MRDRQSASAAVRDLRNAWPEELEQARGHGAVTALVPVLVVRHAMRRHIACERRRDVQVRHALPPEQRDEAPVGLDVVGIRVEHRELGPVRADRSREVADQELGDAPRFLGVRAAPVVRQRDAGEPALPDLDERGGPEQPVLGEARGPAIRNGPFAACRPFY